MNMQEKMHNQQQGYTDSRSNNSKPEGTISVDFMPPYPKKKPKLDKAGDFVDFEEIDKK